jgi:hypothetical protein
MDLYCSPLDRWDGPRRPQQERHRAGYAASWATVTSDLAKEAAGLGADEVLILLDVARDQLRMDGSGPKADADPPPAVAVFMPASNVGALRFQCDRWDRWRDNVRAIGLTLQRLRLIDELGVAHSGQQYTGWTAIGMGEAGPLNRDEALAVLQRHAGPDGADSRSWQDLYRLAVKTAHPDRGGSAAAFREVQAAKDVLTAAGKA